MIKHLLPLAKYYKKYWLKTVLGFLFVLAANIFKVMNPEMVKKTGNGLEAFVKSGNTDTVQYAKILLVFLLTYLAFALLEATFTFLMRQMLIVVSRRVEYDMKNDIYNHYQQLDLAFYRKNNTGDLMNRITEDVSRVRMFLGPSLMYTANLIFMFALAVPMMLATNVKLTLFVLLPLPIIVYLIYSLNGKINVLSEALQAKLSDITTNAQESYSGIRVVQAYSQEDSMVSFFAKESDDYRTISLRLAKMEAVYFPIITFLVGICLLILLYYGGVLYGKGQIGIGDILQFIMYINMLTFPVSALGWTVSNTQRAAVSMRRITDFLRIKSAVQNDTGICEKITGNIEFRNVTFTYPDTGITALKNVSFSIKAGEKWAIAGKTGSGKSTIADLLMRMYDVQQGEILVDGRNIKSYETGCYRNEIGFVPQDIFLFSESIKDNINFGVAAEKATSELAIDSAINSAVHADVLQFPEQYDTIVGERGVTLSGGQKQRITIARALAKNPAVLIMDDSLSAVDTVTEKQIENTLQTILKDKTSILITHRIFSALKFDGIIVLDNGEIAEIGAHEALLSSGKIYASLYKLQQHH